MLDRVSRLTADHLQGIRLRLGRSLCFGLYHILDGFAAVRKCYDTEMLLCFDFPSKLNLAFFTTSGAKKRLKWMALLGNLEMLPRLWFTPTLHPLMAFRDVVNALNASQDWLPKTRHGNSCLDNCCLHAGTPQASFIGVKECFRSDWDSDVRFVVLLWTVTQI